jgi:hypothetical protein
MTGAETTKAATLFTPASANRALPYVRVVVDDLVEAFGRVRRADTLRKRAQSGHASAGATPAERETVARQAEEEGQAARADLQRTLRELEAVGVEVKDPETGLVDFPGEIGGQRVLLCWKRGEESVAWWHDLETGYAGRRPLPSGS